VLSGLPITPSNISTLGERVALALEINCAALRPIKMLSAPIVKDKSMPAFLASSTETVASISATLIPCF
jgi:hypothetical protein